MMKFLILSLVTSLTLVSCTTVRSPTSPIPPPKSGAIVPVSPSPDWVTPIVPDATVTTTPATPADTEPTLPDSTIPASPASDVVTPIGTQTNTSNTSSQSE